MKDLELENLIKFEEHRQNEGLELIASENYPSLEVREACSSIFTAKYAEGYPGHRYYGGCQYVDELETLAVERAKKLFDVPYANVQPHSGSQANFAAYRALLKHRDKILSLSLNDGGHLTHGSPVSFSSDLYTIAHYSLNEEGRLDYELIERRLLEENPHLFLAGYSAYPYAIDFKKLREIIDRHNESSPIKCFFMVDMAHIAGIVAAGLCQNPCLYADVVTSTTHKTLRGPRGGLILSRRKDLAKALDSAVFPYAQGGPLQHIIAAKAVNFLEDLAPSFKDYMRQVLDNTDCSAEYFKSKGKKVFGSENHLYLLETLSSYGLNGKEAQERLESAGITTNKNMIPGDKMKPAFTSGLRIGFAAITSRGCTKEMALEISFLIDEVLANKDMDASFFLPKAKEIASRLKDINALSYLQ